MLRELSKDTLDQALAGRRDQLDTLIDGLTPIIQVRVARALLRRPGRRTGAPLRQEVEDLVQEVLLSLFDGEGKVLRRWDPARGMSLRNYVGLIAERRVVSILRGGRQAEREDPTDPEGLDRVATDPSAERRAADRQTLGTICARLRESVSPLGWRMFRLLFVEERSPGEITERTGLSADAIYAWRSRLRGRARRLAQELADELAEETSTEIQASRRIPEAEDRTTDREPGRSPPPRITGGSR